MYLHMCTINLFYLLLGMGICNCDRTRLNLDFANKAAWEFLCAMLFASLRLSKGVLTMKYAFARSRRRCTAKRVTL